MRHRVSGKKLGRSTGHRTALRRNLVAALFQHERIETTEAKAAAIRGQAEELITIAKRGIGASQGESGDASRNVHARRLAGSRMTRWVTDGDGVRVDLVRKLFEEIAPRYMERDGGYTRVYRLGPRKGDGAPMVLLELVEE